MRIARVAAIAGMLTLLLAGPALAGEVANLSVTKTDSPDPVTPGANLTYTITVANLGSSSASDVSLLDTLPAGTTFVSFTSPAGWTSITPAPGGTGNVSSTNPTLATSSAAFTLVVQVGAGVANGTVITNTATVTSETFDTDLANNTSTATTTVAAPTASIPNAAMPAPSAGSPLAILGFAVLLVGLLTSTAVLAARRIRS